MISASLIYLVPFGATVTVKLCPSRDLHLQAVCQIWTIVYMALDEVIRFEIENHVGGK